MAKSGRYGKYGEVKRRDRLRIKQGIPGRVRSRKGPSASGPLWRGRNRERCRLSVEQAAGDDAEYLKDLSRRAFGRYGPYDGMMAAWFRSEKTKTFVAWLGKKRAGFVMIGPSCPLEGRYPACELLAIAVGGPWRGMGIGRALMSRALAEAVNQGIKTLVLHTEPANEPAVRLFERSGFVRTSSLTPRFYPRGQDAVLMYKQLN